MPQPTFSVIIPVFNKWELTRDCLASLREHTPGDDFEVIVVDNASSDATASELEPLGRALFGESFTAIRNPDNLNFGPACNAGAKAAAAPLLFFLNNDTLLTPGWFEPLQMALRADGSLGAVGPLLLYANGTVQHLGVACSTSGVFHLYNGFPADHPVVGRKRKLQAITAAAFLVPREVFFQAGAFYEGYRNGFEDVELCARIRENGLKLQCITESRVFHLESQSAGRSEHNEYNSQLLTRRCPQAYRPDLHLHGMRDGFKVVLNEPLGQSLLVSDEEDARLRAQAIGRPYEVLFSLVKRHPYWLWGHETLGKVLEEAGNYLEAAFFYAQIVNFYPNYEAALTLLRLARLAGDESLIRETLLQVDNFQTLRADKNRQILNVRRLIVQAERLNDRLLLQLFTDKLLELRGEKSK